MTNPLTKLATMLTRNRQSSGVRAGYEGGKTTQRNAGWRPRNRTGDYELKTDSPLLTARARWLGRNNPWCVGAKQTIVDNVIGCGIQTRANVTVDGEPLTEWNRQADDWFDRWQDEADVTGQQHWSELTRTNLDQVIESGEGLLVETIVSPQTAKARGWETEIHYEAIEPDQIDLTKDRTAGPNVNAIRRGIEFDSFSKPVAMYLYKEHPGGLLTRLLQSERIPMERIIHLYRRTRPTQTRGVSWYAPVVSALWNAYEYTKYEIDAAKVASLFVALYKSDNLLDGEDPLGLVDSDGKVIPLDQDGNPQSVLGAGTLMYGGASDNLQMISGNRPNSQPVAWLRFLLQTMGVGIGLSYIRLTGDFSQTNFSSARAADLQDRKHFEPLQRWHIHTVDAEIRKRVTRHLIVTGRLPVPNGGVARFNRNPRRWLALEAQPPGWGYVDPQKEITAAIHAIGAGLSSWRLELAKRGHDWRQVFRDIAAEKKLAKELELDLILFGQGMGTPVEQKEEPDEPTDDLMAAPADGAEVASWNY